MVPDILRIDRLIAFLHFPFLVAALASPLPIHAQARRPGSQRLH